MPTTIPQAFLRLKSNLEITDLQTETVSTRQQEADVVIFVVLNSRYFHHYNQGQNGGQAGLLDQLKRTLLKTYTRTPDISRNGQAVTIRFEDFVVDVIPAFNREGGGYWRCRD